MHLFNLDDFAKQFGIDMTVADFNDAVREASKAATRTVASTFRFHDFNTYTGRRDIFNVRRMFDAGSNQSRSFRLSRGFIDSVTGFSAYYTSNPVYVRINDTTLLTDLQDVNEDGQSDYLFIDADKGILTVYNLDLTDQWVVVTYNAGLTASISEEYQGVPEWLADAAKAQTALFLRENRAFETEGNNDLTTLRNQIQLLWSSHARIKPDLILPVASEPGA